MRGGLPFSFCRRVLSDKRPALYTLPPPSYAGRFALYAASYAGGMPYTLPPPL